MWAQTKTLYSQISRAATYRAASKRFLETQNKLNTLGRKWESGIRNVAKAAGCKFFNGIPVGPLKLFRLRNPPGPRWKKYIRGEG